MRRFLSWFVALDRILKGDATRVADLKDDSIRIPVGGITFVLILLGVVYGACMGCYALANRDDNRMQIVASMVKVPSLFLLTLLVTLPSLYVFNALVGSRLTVGGLVRLFIASLAVNLAVLSSLGPIVAFFSVNTTTYGFMVFLNVVVFGVAGILGLGFLLQTLQRLHMSRYGWPLAPRRIEEPSASFPPSGEAADAALAENFVPAEVVEPSDPTGPLEPLGGRALAWRIKAVFSIWMVVFGLVGAQMSWILRPFIGSPGTPFEWLRPRGSNFFEAFANVLRSLFS